MTTNELEVRLREEKFRPSSYSLRDEDGVVNDAMCLRCEAGIWTVFYTERGLRFDVETFQSEDDATEYIYAALLSDPANRLGYKSPYEAPMIRSSDDAPPSLFDQ